MKDPREVIIRPIVTEHSYDQMENNVYTFEVTKDSNKVEIRQAIEAIFNVSVVKVNTLNVKPKPKRVRYQVGQTRTWKKAMVTLKEGDTIEVWGANYGCVSTTLPLEPLSPPRHIGRGALLYNQGKESTRRARWGHGVRGIQRCSQGVQDGRGGGCRCRWHDLYR